MLIRYMMTRENVLRRVHFVENFRQLSRVIVVSTTCVSIAAFRYYRRNKPVSTDVEQAFLDFYQHPDEDIYVGLFFKDRGSCSPYTAVLEEIAPVELEPAVREMVALQAEWVIEQSLRTQQRLKLMEQVNAALDRGDRQAFYEASEQLIQFDACATLSAS